MTESHLALLRSLRAEIEAGRKSYGDMCEAFARHVPLERLDDVAAAMTIEERQRFLVRARSFLSWGEERIVERWAGDSPDWTALAQWVYRQPFAKRPWRPLAEIKNGGAKGWERFEYLIPHLARSPVEEVVEELRPLQSTRMLVNFAEALRPGLDVVVAVAREHDRSPEAFTKLNAWALGIRPFPYWPRPHEWTPPPESSWGPTPEGMTEPPCPFCGAPSAVPMVYGDVSFDAMDWAEQRQIIIAGAFMRRDAPTHQCRRCVKQFCDPVAAANRTWDGEEVPIDEWVSRVITALGQPDAFITDWTRVSWFLDSSGHAGVGEYTPGGPLLDFRANPYALLANEKLLANASRALRFPLETDDKIIDLARRLREQSTR